MPPSRIIPAMFMHIAGVTLKGVDWQKVIGTAWADNATES